MNNINYEVTSGVRTLDCNGIRVRIPEYSLPNISSIDMKFLNGQVTIPAQYGGYVIASGCGSGKTTCIKMLMLAEYNKGIVYSASTINECNEMYEFLKTYGPSYGLNESDIIVLHSGLNDDGVDLSVYRNRPDKLANYKIIICTHHKLLNGYPELFLAYERNLLVRSDLSHLSRGGQAWDENGQCRLPRQYIIVDEMPTCQSFSFKVNKQVMRILGIADTIISYNSKGEPYITAKLPLHYTNGGTYTMAEEIYRSSGYSILGKKLKAPSNMDIMRDALALSMIYERYDQLMYSLENSDEADPQIELTYTLADQVEALGKTFGKTRYLIFDGTGDLTFTPRRIRQSDGTEILDYCPFTILTYKNKYNSSINISKLTFNCKREYRCMNDFYKAKNRIIDSLNNRIDKVKELVSESHKVLIITWKDFKIKDERRGVTYVTETGDIIEVNIEDYIKLKLMNETGFVEGRDFSVIHYQSGLDKATNQFRDCDTILFLGEFHVPNYVVDKFNQDYRVKTSVENYTLYQLVQAICRTRIRKHRSEPIDIYYTEDWDDELMNKLVNYISSDKIKYVHDTTLNFIKPKWRPVVELFCSLNSDFRTAIETRTGYRLEFSLDDIYELVPMNDKKLRLYQPLINYLKTLGIELKINTTWGRNRFSR